MSRQLFFDISRAYIKIRQAKPAETPIKLANTAGLYIDVKPSGCKLWRYCYRIAGCENLFAIGEYPQVSLTDGHEAPDDARELNRERPLTRPLWVCPGQ